MPRYFFHVEDGISLQDHTGCELPGLDQARLEALQRTVALLAERGQGFWHGHNWKMTATDAEQRILFTLNFLAVNAPMTEQYGRRLSE